MTHIHIRRGNIQEHAFTLFDSQGCQGFILLCDAVDTSERWVDS
jgi:hypothetical protein